MNTPFSVRCRQLRRATFHLLVATLVFLGLTVICAWLGFSQGVISLREATGSLACALAAFFALCMIASLIGWNVRRRQFRQQTV